MKKEIARLKADISYQRNGIDALLSITKPGAEFPTVENIFQRAIGPIQRVTGFETVAARIYDPDRKCFILMAQSGMTPEMVDKLKFRFDDSPNFLEIMSKKMPVVKTPQEFVRKLGFEKTTFVPLVAGDIIVGSIELARKSDYFLTDDEFRWFALVGRMLGSMIYQVQLMERLQNQAMIRERTHLASALHDDVAQLVRSMRWGLEETRSALENNQLEHVAGILEKLETTVQHASSYLREEMLCLRERVDTDQEIIPVLEGMLLRFERNWGIKTTFLVESDVATNQEIFLSPQAVMQLIRIVQEALTNIRRHAKAHTVTIKVSKSEDSIVFTIMDDGIGFPLDKLQKDERLGLHIIRERASCVGATLQIASIEGIGTTLKIDLPSKAGSL